MKCHAQQERTVNSKMEPCNQNHCCERKQRGWVHIGRNPATGHHDLGGQFLKTHHIQQKTGFIRKQKCKPKRKSWATQNQPELVTAWERLLITSGNLTWEMGLLLQGQIDAAGNPRSLAQGDTQILPLLSWNRSARHINFSNSLWYRVCHGAA